MDQGLPLPSDPPLRRRRFRLRKKNHHQAPGIPEPLAVPEPLVLADAPALEAAADLADAEPLAPPSAPVELAAGAVGIEGIEGVVDVEVSDVVADAVEGAVDAAVVVVEERAAPAAREAFIDRHPMLAKSLSMGLTYGLADTAAQVFAVLKHGEVLPIAARARRAASLTAVGCLAVGPILAVWFDFLERIVPGRSKRAIAARTTLDQAIEVPFMISLIFTLSSLAEGHGPAYCLAKIQLKLLRTWRDCTGVWVPAQLVNQGLIPLKYRVMFQAFISFFWDAYLSIVSHA